MSKRPDGFKTQEDYNAYMRNYKAKCRTEKTLKYYNVLIRAYIIPKEAVEDKIVRILVK